MSILPILCSGQQADISICGRNTSMNKVPGGRMMHCVAGRQYKTGGNLQDGQEECGVFYWEPEVTAKILPDAYPLGAAKLVGEKTLQYHKALRAYQEC